MEEYGNNGIFGVDMKQMRAADGKQEIYLEWPKLQCWMFLVLVRLVSCIRSYTVIL